MSGVRGTRGRLETFSSSLSLRRPSPSDPPWRVGGSVKRSYYWRVDEEDIAKPVSWPQLCLTLKPDVHSFFREARLDPAPGGRYWLRMACMPYMGEGQEHIEIISFRGHSWSPSDLQQLLRYWGALDYLDKSGSWFSERAVSVSETSPRHVEMRSSLAHMGFVYCVQDAINGGPVKIGFSGDPVKRHRDIQSVNPYPIWVVGTFPGTQRMEGELHEHFKRYRRHGEFFSPAPELIRYFAEHSNFWWIPEMIPWESE